MLDRSTTPALEFGGSFIPETAVAYIAELIETFEQCQRDDSFIKRRDALFQNFAERPTALHHATRLSKHIGGASIFIKRQDSGAASSHHMLSAIVQVLMAQRMDKGRILTNTGSGLAGIAVASACKQIGDFQCVVYMGESDIKQNQLCVQRMKYLGAKVVPVSMGASRFREAVSSAMQDWVGNITDTFYVLCPPIGPSPYPQIVEWSQSAIGEECKEQFELVTGTQPDTVIAGIDGGGGAIGMFASFSQLPDTRLIGVQAGGQNCGPDGGSAPITYGSPGLYHGFYSWVLQSKDGQVPPVSSIASGLAYPAVGPRHAQLHASGHAEYVVITDDEALSAARLLAHHEGLVVSLEGGHAIAAAIKEASWLSPEKSVVVGPVTSGDKDLSILLEDNA